MVELTDIEKLAVAQAYQNVIGDLTATKRPDNLRGRVDAQIRAMYESFTLAPKSFDVNLMGEKVGTMSVTATKPTEERVETELEVTDSEEFRAWAIGMGFFKVDMEACRRHMLETGEIPDGCVTVERTIPADAGGKVKHTTLRVNTDKVVDVLGNSLGEYTAKMLEAGDE